MGILPSGIFGGFYKKTGPVVGRITKGKNVVTGLYHPSTNPSTEKQLTEQQKFTMLNAFFNGISPLVNIGFKLFAKRRNALNEAYKFNCPNAFVLVGGQYQIDYPKMVYSRGNVDRPNGLQIAVINGHVAFSWIAVEETMFCRLNDKATFLVYNAVRNEFIWTINAAERQQLGYSLEMPSEYAGDLLHCYMNFNNENGKITGDSVYAGLLIFE